MYVSYVSEKKHFLDLPNTRMNFSTKIADYHKSPHSYKSQDCF